MEVQREVGGAIAKVKLPGCPGLNTLKHYLQALNLRRELRSLEKTPGFHKLHQSSGKPRVIATVARVVHGMSETTKLILENGEFGLECAEKAFDVGNKQRRLGLSAMIDFAKAGIGIREVKDVLKGECEPPVQRLPSRGKQQPVVYFFDGDFRRTENMPGISPSGLIKMVDLAFEFYLKSKQSPGETGRAANQPSPSEFIRERLGALVDFDSQVPVTPLELWLILKRVSDSEVLGDLRDGEDSSLLRNFVEHYLMNTYFFTKEETPGRTGYGEFREVVDRYEGMFSDLLKCLGNCSSDDQSRKVALHNLVKIKMRLNDWEVAKQAVERFDLWKDELERASSDKHIKMIENFLRETFPDQFRAAVRREQWRLVQIPDISGKIRITTVQPIDAFIFGPRDWTDKDEVDRKKFPDPLSRVETCKTGEMEYVSVFNSWGDQVYSGPLPNGAVLPVKGPYYVLDWDDIPEWAIGKTTRVADYEISVMGLDDDADTSSDSEPVNLSFDVEVIDTDFMRLKAKGKFEGCKYKPNPGYGLDLPEVLDR